MHLTSATAGKAVAGAVVSLALLLTACSDDGGDEDTDSTDTTEEATATGGDGDGSNDATETTLSVDEEILAAYDDAVAAVEVAYEAADPDHPDLVASFAGRSLTLHQNALREYQGDGIADEVLERESDTTVSHVVGDTATVEECYAETIQVVDLETREPRGEPDELSELVEWQMERIDGTWKVVQGTVLEESCEPGS